MSSPSISMTRFVAGPTSFGSSTDASRDTKMSIGCSPNVKSAPATAPSASSRLNSLWIEGRPRLPARLRLRFPRSAVVSLCLNPARLPGRITLLRSEIWTWVPTILLVVLPEPVFQGPAMREMKYPHAWREVRRRSFALVVNGKLHRTPFAERDFKLRFS